MNNIISLAGTEWLKTKRTSSIWLTVLGAGFIPALLILAFLNKPASNVKYLGDTIWLKFIGDAWQAENYFLFPMYVILICSLVTQVEFRNNTWKQVYASPVSTNHVYLSKLINIVALILLFFVLFNIFLFGSALVINLVNRDFKFLSSPVPWKSWLTVNVKTFVAVLGITGIQYWISMRFRNFILSIGVGLALLVLALVGHDRWDHEYLFPYSYPILTLKTFLLPADTFFTRHEWLSMLWFGASVAFGLADTKRRREY